MGWKQKNKTVDKTAFWLENRAMAKKSSGKQNKQGQASAAQRRENIRQQRQEKLQRTQQHSAIDAKPNRVRIVHCGLCWELRSSPSRSSLAFSSISRHNPLPATRTPQRL